MGLWCRQAAAAQIPPLAWELLYAKGVALKKTKKKKRKETVSSEAGVRMCARYGFISSRLQIHCQVPGGRFSHQFYQHSTTVTSATVASALSNEVWISKEAEIPEAFYLSTQGSKEISQKG